MRQRRSKWALAVAAPGLVLGAAATYGLLRDPSPAPAPPVHTAPNVLPVADGLSPPLRAPSFKMAPLNAAEMAAIAARAPAAGAPQFGSYADHRDYVMTRGSNLFAFYFTRGVYSGGRGYGRRRGGGSWATDYPKADIQFLWGLKRLTNIDAYDYENAVLLTDPDLRRYPFLYMLEVGYMQLTPPEVEGLRDYLAAGGFLFIDDFWGTYEWENFVWEIHKVLPGSEIVDLPLDHPLFTTFYDIDEILQIPNVGNARAGYTSERDGYVPYVRAISDDRGRLLVLINWNTDLGDAWEWAEDPYYPLTYSNYAYQMAVNAIVYAMSH